MKKCFKCGKVQPLTEYYEHSQMGDGRLNKCKTCAKMDAQKDYHKNIVRPEWLVKERKRGRQKYHRLYAGETKTTVEARRRWEEKYPEKRPASIVAYANIDTPPGFENHHWSYNQEHWVDVIFLTKKHHMKAHRFIIYDQDSKMYRRYDTDELLDTKVKHERFIKWCIENKED